MQLGAISKVKCLFVVLAVCSPLLGQTYTTVNKCGNSTNTGSANSIAVTLASAGGTSGCTTNVTTGDLLDVSCGGDSGGTINTPTDTQSNTWTQQATITGTSGAGNAKIYSAIAKSSGSDTITCNVSTTGKDPHIDAREVSPGAGFAWTGTIVDASGTAQTTSGASVSTSGSTSNANDYISAFVQDSPNSRTITVGSGYGNFVLANDAAGGDSSAGQDKTVSSTGTQSAAFGGTSTDATVQIIIAWKATASGGSCSGSPTLASMGAGCH